MTRESGESESGWTRFALTGRMTIETAEEQRLALLAALAEGPRLEVDLTGVGEADCAGVQLLVSLRASARAQERTVRLALPAAGGLASMIKAAGLLGDQRPDRPVVDDGFWCGKGS
jgi:ABC-type transporter Mla MlaB component